MLEGIMGALGTKDSVIDNTIELEMKRLEALMSPPLKVSVVEEPNIQKAFGVDKKQILEIRRLFDQYEIDTVDGLVEEIIKETIAQYEEAIK